jgi:amino acid transporter
MESLEPQESPDSPQGELRQSISELLCNAHVEPGVLAADERAYLERHALRRPLRTPQIWALGVGAVITGEYFGWNGGLGVAGPLGMLFATLFVCALYMAWVLSLAELTVAMPFAGGPLAFGRRAVGPWFGFLMGWSMFLESLFATIGTAIATGGYIYFVLRLLVEWFGSAEFIDDAHETFVTVLVALATVLLFAFMQWTGARQQARLMEWMTYGAILVFTGA